MSAFALLALLMHGAQAADKSTDRPMAIDNGGRMEFVHAVRNGTLSKEQKASLEERLQAECANPSNPITQGMIETRGPGKCMASCATNARARIARCRRIASLPKAISNDRSPHLARITSCWRAD